MFLAQTAGALLCWRRLTKSDGIGFGSHNMDEGYTNESYLAKSYVCLIFNFRFKPKCEDQTTPCRNVHCQISEIRIKVQFIRERCLRATEVMSAMQIQLFS